MTTCLVSGAAGFIGYALAKDLSEREGYEVICVDNFVRGEHDGAYNALLDKKNVRGYTVDLSDSQTVKSLPTAVDYVYHLAALNGTQNFYEHPYEVLKHSTIPTFNLLEHFSQSHLSRFVYAGSSEAYAGTVHRFGWPVPTDETVPLMIEDITNPRWSYGVSKLHGEVLTSQACKQFDIPWNVVRYHNAYGPRMGYQHVIPDFLERLKSDNAELRGFNDTRSFIYIDDAVNATKLVAEGSKTANKLIHIGSEDEIKMLDLGKQILEIMGKDIDIKCFPSPSGSVERRAADIHLLKKLTSYEPAWSLDRGLRKTIEFYLPDYVIPERPPKRDAGHAKVTAQVA